MAIDIVIKREDMDRVLFPGDGSWECFPAENIEFVVRHGGGCETRHVVLDDRLDVVRDWLGDPDVRGVTVGQLRRVIDSYVGMLTDRVESPTR